MRSEHNKRRSLEKTTQQGMDDLISLHVVRNEHNKGQSLEKNTQQGMDVRGCEKAAQAFFENF